MKIWITVRGGVVESVLATMDRHENEFVAEVVDYDNLREEGGSELCDHIADELAELANGEQVFDVEFYTMGKEDAL